MATVAKVQHKVSRTAKEMGAVGNGSADDTSALQDWVDDALDTGIPLALPPGEYSVDPLQITSEGLSILGCVRGRGTDGRAIIASRNGGSVFEFPSGSVRNLHMQDLTLKGTGTDGGHGLHFQSGLAANPFGVELNRVVIEDMGGKGVYDEKGLFEAAFRQVMTSNCVGDHFDLVGGPTIMFDTCRLWALLAGTTGYKVRSGTGPTWLNCNGVNLAASGAGVKGIELGADTIAHGTVIGCNFEDLDGTAIDLLNGSVVDLLGATTFRPQTITDFVAVKFNTPSNSEIYGFISPTVTFATPTTGSYMDGEPLHGSTSVFRMLSMHKGVRSFWDDLASVSRPLEGPLTFQEMDEISDPAAPAANKGRLYLRDTGGVTELRMRFAGNSRPIMRDVARPTYTLSNVSADRALDANATATDELADVLGTLIQDLIDVGILGS